MPTPARYFIYRELFDRQATKEELQTIIRSLNSFSTVLLTARLSAMFRHATWTKHPQDAKAMEKFQYWFASVFLDPETQQRLVSRFGEQNPASRPIFHPLQFLNIIRLALSSAEGGDDAQPDKSEFHRNQLGTACLMASDLLCTSEEQQNLTTGNVDDRRKQLMLQFLASFEISHPTPLRNLFFRSHATYRIVLNDPEVVRQIREECGGLDIEKDFETLFGLPLMGWLSLVFGAQTVLMMRTQVELHNMPETFIINRKSILPSSALSQNQIDSFFDLLSMSFDELRDEIRRERPVDERLDLVPFKSKPFFVTAPDNYACVDFALVTEKMHNGPYFLLSNKLPENERGNMFKAWGLLFEAYVNWLLKGLDRRHSARFFADASWENGNKSFDAVFVKTRVVVVMEHKGGFLRQDARYSNDLDTFMNDLQSKIGVGCRQLARDIGALFPQSGSPQKLRNIPIPTTTLFVLPILVVQDLMLRTPFINYFLNQRFQSERSQFPTRQNIRVLPLNVVQITHLENLVEIAEAVDVDVFSILHQRCNRNSEMLWELSDVISSIPDAKKDRESLRFQTVFANANDEINSILFKDVSPPAGN